MPGQHRWNVRTHLRLLPRRVIGGCLIVAPLLQFVGGMLMPVSDENTAAYLAGLAAQPQQGAVSSLVSFGGYVLLVPGMIGLLWQLRDRPTVVGYVGAVLAVLGGLCFPATISTNFYDISLAQSPDRQQAIVAVNRALGMPAVQGILVLGIAGVSLGLLLLGVALWRARLAAVWVPVLIGLGLAIVVLGGATPRVMALGYLPLLVALGSLGVPMLRHG